MQFNVPQFIEVEDKIIGPLTLKQFLILLGGGLICFFYWSIFKTNAFFFVLLLPTVVLFAMIAFGKFNGRPLLSNIGSMIGFFFTPRLRIYQRTGEKALLLVKKAPSPKEGVTSPDQQAVVSRLRRLAYFLDQKTAEEERLLQSGQIKERWLNQI